MERIAAGLCHDVDRAARMKTELRLHGVGLHAEFLHGIREGNGQIDVAEGVVIVAAVRSGTLLGSRRPGQRHQLPNGGAHLQGDVLLHVVGNFQSDAGLAVEFKALGGYFQECKSAAISKLGKTEGSPASVVKV